MNVPKLPMITINKEMESGLQTVNEQTGLSVARLVRNGICAVLAGYGIEVTDDIKQGSPKRKARSSQAEQRDDESSVLSDLGISVEVDSDLPEGTIELRGNGPTMRIENIATDLTPAQKIAARKAAAREKFPVPDVPKKKSNADPEDSA